MKSPQQKAFEAIAGQYDIELSEPSESAKRQGAKEVYKYAHTSHLFTIFCHGYSAALAATAPESAPADTPPVAWISEKNLASIFAKGMAYATGFDTGGQIPLYAHPAPSESADQVRDAAIKVLSFRDGELPRRGWLRDTDTSRAALQELADSVLATSSAAKGEAV